MSITKDTEQERDTKDTALISLPRKIGQLEQCFPETRSLKNRAEPRQKLQIHKKLFCLKNKYWNRLDVESNKIYIITS